VRESSDKLEGRNRWKQKVGFTFDHFKASLLQGATWSTEKKDEKRGVANRFCATETA